MIDEIEIAVVGRHPNPSFIYLQFLCISRLSLFIRSDSIATYTLTSPQVQLEDGDEEKSQGN